MIALKITAKSREQVLETSFKVTFIFPYFRTNSALTWEATQVTLMVKNHLPIRRGRDAGSILVPEDPVEEGMAAHSSILT